MDAGQPQEQHGFRADRSIEEHLLTTNLVIDKTPSLDVPIWIATFNCSRRPTSAKHVTSSSNKNFVSPNDVAKRRTSSANLRSKSVNMPCSNTMPPLPIFRRQHPNAISKTHEKNRGLTQCTSLSHAFPDTKQISISTIVSNPPCLAVMHTF